MLLVTTCNATPNHQKTKASDKIPFLTYEHLPATATSSLSASNQCNTHLGQEGPGKVDEAQKIWCKPISKIYPSYSLTKTVMGKIV